MSKNKKTRNRNYSSIIVKNSIISNHILEQKHRNYVLPQYKYHIDQYVTLNNLPLYDAILLLIKLLKLLQYQK